MKALILAAGQGTRLRPLTNDKPKCMVLLESKPLLEHQLYTLKKAGVDNIHVICGYKSEEVIAKGITKHYNNKYDSTNMVYTLFVAKDELDGLDDIIIVYGDIVFEQKVLDSLLNSNAPISVVSDKNWKNYWEVRMTDILNDAESFKLGVENKIVELGKKSKNIFEIKGQYIGLIKVRADMVLKLKEFWNSLDRTLKYDKKDFDNMYMTSFLQLLINANWDLRAVFIENGWLEIDTISDLEIDFTKFYKQNFEE